MVGMVVVVMVVARVMVAGNLMVVNGVHCSEERGKVIDVNYDDEGDGLVESDCNYYNYLREIRNELYVKIPIGRTSFWKNMIKIEKRMY